ncbi:lipopolysaccharide assembly protein LapB [Parahaliea sp. F7430]|uniref:Lipopolysaccharide assembly protein B n=1 Tax=Sediminihaliea albiluteola TaxID=2758564 RepID=A0A7W2TVR1_9GAMM|nr:lipopolysaccharide assembly protein LapB [Sediminihaliea albiluteola]MBA6412857.1 lipopolysaccharide assembly protein LapB [Sediminihaliea albiluteola]
MNDLLIFALLFVATGLGWYLGSSSAKARTSVKRDLPSQYYRGLNYLLDGRPDGAVDAFIDALEVNSETLETHIALGNLLRKRGEVDRAIRIHQNLLARPSLPQAQVHQAHLELARDYISAGLLDRAERLLLDLIKESAEQRRPSQRYLLEIYQSQREWSEAIALAKQLLPRKSLLGSSTVVAQDSAQGQPVSLVLAHYYCELASDKQAAGELLEAAKLLQQALNHDKHCVRASIMQGELEQAAGNSKQAIKALRRVKQQDPDYIPETIATLRSSYAAVDDLAAFRSYLDECLEEHPSVPLMMAVAEDLRAADGSDAAAGFLTEQLTQQPSLRGLARLIHLQIDDAQGKVRDDLALLQVVIDRLIEERPAYRCGKCGFSGRQLHWYCPGCKCWGTIKAIRGARAD